MYANGKENEILGQMIQKLKWKRTELVISTNILWKGQGSNVVDLSCKHIIQDTQACLRCLHMDYVDVLFCHQPDKSTPLEELKPMAERLGVQVAQLESEVSAVSIGTSQRYTLCSTFYQRLDCD
ncbi:hypothetical protein KP509_15G009900 [Ceratopteris richardii]|uniref:NADP-dependent oxidoreductase domain-containing protein n=1 Tax=Ceratopteris richardii TaxID=49495 RepID=A0A8T2T0X4_CERRI|nr:hypothetical protein KP509_15G009900 [Ceratopteris richardii]